MEIMKPRKNLESVQLRKSMSSFDGTLDRFAVTSSDNRILVWDTSSADLMLQLFEPKHLTLDFSCMCWCGDSRPKEERPIKKVKRAGQSLLAVGTGTGSIVIFDLLKAEERFHLESGGGGHTAKINDLVGNNTGEVLFSCSDDNLVCQWSIRSKTLIHKWAVGKSPVRKIALAPDGSVLATVGISIKLWDISSYKMIKKFSSQAASVACLKFSPDSRFLISTTGDRFVNFWSCDPKDASKVPLRVFSCESTPWLLQIVSHAYESSRKKRVVHVLAATEAGTINVWSVTGESHDSAYKKPDGIIRLNATKTKSKQDQPSSSARILSAQFHGGEEIIVACGPEAAPSFHKVRYVDGDNWQIIHQIDVGAEQNRTDVPGANSETVSSHSQPVVLTTRAHPLPGVLNEPQQATPSRTSNSRVDPTKDPWKSTSPAASVSTNESLAEPLMQALHSGDRAKLHECFYLQKESTVRNTVANLDPSFIYPLLRHLITLLRSQPRNPTPYRYLANIIQCHSSYLLSSCNLNDCNALYSIVNSRLSHYPELLKIKGRLDMLLSRKTDQQPNTRPRIVPLNSYVDNDENFDHGNGNNSTNTSGSEEDGDAANLEDADNESMAADEEEESDAVDNSGDDNAQSSADEEEE